MIDLLSRVVFAVGVLFMALMGLEAMYAALFRPFPHKPYVFLTVKKLLSRPFGGSNDA